MISKQKKTIENALFFSFVLLFFIFPFHRVASTIPAIILITFSIYYSFINNISILANIKNHTFLKLLLLFFLIGLIGYFQEDNITEFINKAKLKVFFAIIPLLIFNFKDILRKKIKTIFQTIIIGSSLSIIMFYIVAIYKFQEIGTKAFLYSELVSVSLINPIVYSFVLNVCILFIYYKSNYSKLIKHLLILFYALTIFLLLSKMGIIILLLSYSYIIYDEFKQNKIKLLVIILLLISFSTIFLFKSNNSIISTRINVFKYHFNNNDSNNPNKMFPRVVIFKSATNIIKENFIIGVGSSNSKEALNKEFVKIGYKTGIKKNYDSHNQYLEQFLASGVIGFTSFILLFMYLFKISIQKKNKLLFHFTVMIAFGCLVESLFESQMGVFLFLLYSSIILIEEKENTLEELNTQQNF